jgi:hypothetical protein
MVPRKKIEEVRDEEPTQPVDTRSPQAQREAVYGIVHALPDAAIGSLLYVLEMSPIVRKIQGLGPEESSDWKQVG